MSGLQGLPVSRALLVADNPLLPPNTKHTLWVQLPGIPCLSRRGSPSMDSGRDRGWDSAQPCHLPPYPATYASRHTPHLPARCPWRVAGAGCIPALPPAYLVPTSLCNLKPHGQCALMPTTDTATYLPTFCSFACRAWQLLHLPDHYWRVRAGSIFTTRVTAYIPLSAKQLFRVPRHAAREGLLTARLPACLLRAKPSFFACAFRPGLVTKPAVTAAAATLTKNVSLAGRHVAEGRTRLNMGGWYIQ